MSKELVALKDFYIFFKQCEIENKYDEQLTNHFLSLLNVIEKALKEKEKQDHYIETLEDGLNNAETTCARYKKALEIIKEKSVVMPRLLTWRSLEDYNWVLLPKYRLTQEEYDLLKEILL